MLKHKVKQTIIAIVTKDKVIKLFFMADEFFDFLGRMMARYTQDIRQRT